MVETSLVRCFFFNQLYNYNQLWWSPPFTTLCCTFHYPCTGWCTNIFHIVWSIGFTLAIFKGTWFYQTHRPVKGEISKYPPDGPPRLDALLDGRTIFLEWGNSETAPSRCICNGESKVSMSQSIGVRNGVSWYLILSVFCYLPCKPMLLRIWD